MRRAPVRRQNFYIAGPALFAAGIAIASCATESTLGPIGTPPTTDGQSQLAATSGGVPSGLISGNWASTSLRQRCSACRS